MVSLTHNLWVRGDDIAVIATGNLTIDGHIGNNRTTCTEEVEDVTPNFSCISRRGFTKELSQDEIMHRWQDFTGDDAVTNLHGFVTAIHSNFTTYLMAFDTLIITQNSEIKGP